jgi:hypothetical protein
MPTDNVKEIMDGDIFIQDKEGNINKIAQIAQLENTATEEKDDVVDAMRYYAESMQSGDTFTMDKASARRLKKMVGLETITRKRFKKLLMGCGLQRNDAEIIAEAFHNSKIRYTPLAVQNIIETIIKEAEKEGEM